MNKICCCDLKKNGEKEEPQNQISNEQYRNG